MFNTHATSTSNKAQLQHCLPLVEGSGSVWVELRRRTCFALSGNDRFGILKPLHFRSHGTQHTGGYVHTHVVPNILYLIREVKKKIIVQGMNVINISSPNQSNSHRP